MTGMRGLGQPIAAIKALGGLATGAIIIYIVYQFAGEFLPRARARAPGGYGGMVANDWLNTGLDSVLPATFLVLMFFGFVAWATYSSGV